MPETPDAIDESPVVLNSAGLREVFFQKHNGCDRLKTREQQVEGYLLSLLKGNRASLLLMMCRFGAPGSKGVDYFDQDALAKAAAEFTDDQLKAMLNVFLDEHFPSRANRNVVR